VVPGLLAILVSLEKAGGAVVGRMKRGPSDFRMPIGVSLVGLERGTTVVAIYKARTGLPSTDACYLVLVLSSYFEARLTRCAVYKRMIDVSWMTGTAK